MLEESIKASLIADSVDKFTLWSPGATFADYTDNPLVPELKSSRNERVD